MVAAVTKIYLMAEWFGGRLTEKDLYDLRLAATNEEKFEEAAIIKEVIETIKNLEIPEHIKEENEAMEVVGAFNKLYELKLLSSFETKSIQSKIIRKYGNQIFKEL
jgi:excinuclease UvrABC nuclease subunit